MIKKQPPARALPTTEDLNKRIDALKLPHGRIVTLSGVGTSEPNTPRHGSLWPGHEYSIPAFPPGDVLWLGFTVPTQIFTVNSPGPINNTSQSMRMDCTLEWGWELIANPFYFPAPRARFATDFGTFAFYSSVSPGSVGFSAAWIVPGQTTVLTDSKENDPSPLDQFLGTLVDGRYRLWFRHKAEQLIVNHEPSLWATSDPPPEAPHWRATIALRHSMGLEDVVEPAPPR